MTTVLSNIKMYRSHIDISKSKAGRIELIVLPDGSKTWHNYETELTDFSVLEPYVGHLVDYYVDGKYQWTAPIEKIDYVDWELYGRTDIGKVNTVFFGDTVDWPGKEKEEKKNGKHVQEEI